MSTNQPTLTAEGTTPRRRPPFAGPWPVLMGLPVLALAAALPGLPAAGAESPAAEAEADGNPPPRTHEYAVYLSPRFEKGVRWGGYHVTVAGFSASHALGKGQKAILHDAWAKVFGGKAWHLHKKEGKDLWFVQDANGWRADFQSDRLHELAKYLRHHGFKDVHEKWHVSLYGHSKGDARGKFGGLEKQDWHLWLVRKPSKECQLHGKDCHADLWEKIH